jgi:glycosyltransferase involved in cell wall biosynthesis
VFRQSSCGSANSLFLVNNVPVVSVVIPTHNPHPGRLQRTLRALREQTLPASQWETVLVDNASDPAVVPAALNEFSPPNLRVVREPRLGLTAARQRGVAEAKGEFVVLVDDDNMLSPDYLGQVLAVFARHPRIGIAGGKSIPEFEREPLPWQREFLPLLALRDLGPVEIISTGLYSAEKGRNDYPLFSPIGAGMALRREVWLAWLAAARARVAALSDRRGAELTSSGDNDIVLSAMRAEWQVGYYPELHLTHLIPAGRLEADYLARLNRGIQKSWMQVLSLHEANPWPPLSSLSALFRKVKAWFIHRAWTSSVARIRWQGACGHFDGRVRSR